MASAAPRPAVSQRAASLAMAFKTAERRRSRAEVLKKAWKAALAAALTEGIGRMSDTPSIRGRYQATPTSGGRLARVGPTSKMQG